MCDFFHDVFSFFEGGCDFVVADVVVDISLFHSTLCLDHCKSNEHRRAYYGFHCYMELCLFVYCLLSRSRNLVSLPVLNDWD